VKVNPGVARQHFESLVRFKNAITKSKKRFASERSNSTIKEDKKIVDKPGILHISRAHILAQMAAIVLLLTRAFSFVVKITCQIR